MNGPRNGAVAFRLMPTTVAQYAVWSQGAGSPVKPSSIASAEEASTPMSQFSSRGYL